MGRHCRQCAQCPGSLRSAPPCPDRFSQKRSCQAGWHMCKPSMNTAFAQCLHVCIVSMLKCMHERFLGLFSDNTYTLSSRSAVSVVCGRHAGRQAFSRGFRVSNLQLVYVNTKTPDGGTHVIYVNQSSVITKHSINNELKQSHNLCYCHYVKLDVTVRGSCFLCEAVLNDFKHRQFKCQRCFLSIRSKQWARFALSKSLVRVCM